MVVCLLLRSNVCTLSVSDLDAATEDRRLTTSACAETTSAHRLPRLAVPFNCEPRNDFPANTAQRVTISAVSDSPRGSLLALVALMVE